MSYLPAEVFKDPSTGMSVLEVLDALTHIVPRQEPSSMISPSNRARLSNYNRRSLDRALNEGNLEQEVKKFERSKELFSEIAKTKTEYGKFSQNSNLIYNRFSDVKDKVIKGVGVDGSGMLPVNYTQERHAYAMIEQGADKFDAWPSYTGDEEEILKASCGNVAFWQAASMAQLPIGTPVEVASGIIQLMCPLIGSHHADNTMASHITGNDWVKKRIECNNLKYLLDGSKLDLDDKDMDGKRIFMETSFRRLFFGKQNINIKYAKDNDKNEKLETEDQKKIFGDEFRKDMEDLLYGGMTYYSSNTGDAANKKNKAIMFLYYICFMYGSYIYKLYDKLIEQVRGKNDKILEDEYSKARLYMMRNYLNLVNAAIVKHFKLRVEPGDLITVAERYEEIKQTTKNPSGTGTTTTTTTTTTVKQDNLEPLKINQVLNNIRTDKLEQAIYVGFTQIENYNLITKGLYDKEGFGVDKFPIVFEKEVISGKQTIQSVNYRETIERLVKFLTLGGEMPKVKGEVVPVGAPMQNDEIMEATSGALAGYYQEVTESKSVYLSYMDLKLNIFRAGVSSRDIVDLRDYLLNQFGLIGRTMSTQQQKEIACVKLVGQIMEQYKKLRKEEMRLTDDKTVIVYGRRRELGEKMEDYPRQIYRAMKRVKAGTEAVVRLEVAKLTYGLFMSRNPGVQMCSNFLPLLMEKAGKIDASMNGELARMMEKKMVELERKYGANVLKTIQSDMRLVTLSGVPKPPENYMKTIGTMFSTIGAKIPGLPTGTGTGMMGIPGGPAAGPGGPIAKKVLPLEQRLRVEQAKFWQDLRTAFNGRTILLPVARLKTGSVFDDGEFYMIDVFRSMMFNRIDAVRLTTGGKITAKVIFGRVQQRGYVMMTNTTEELGNPNQWRAINHNNLVRMLVRDEGIIKFKNIRKARGVFFNLIANGSFLVDSANISIPEGSNVSLGLVKYCSNVLKKELPKCNILISRGQFGQTVQGRMDMMTGTKGIDMASGVSFVDYSPVAGLGNDDIVKR